MSIKKKPQPSIEEVNHVMIAMTMDQIRATDVFHKMPKSVMLGEIRIPKSQLRRLHLAKAYVQYGGKVIPQQTKKIKNYTKPTKQTAFDKKTNDFKRSLSKDHYGDVSQLQHELKTDVYSNQERKKQAQHRAASAATPDLETQQDDLLSWMQQLSMNMSSDDEEV